MVVKKITNADDFRQIEDKWITLYLIYKGDRSPKMVFARIVEEYHDAANYPRGGSNRWMNFIKYGTRYSCEGWWSSKEIKEHVKYILSKGGTIICSPNEMEFSSIRVV